MTLSKAEREALRMMFGGRCAYCGCELSGKWHADHVEAVERGGGWVKVPRENAPMGYDWKYKGDGKLGKPENDRFDNLFPSCVKCNILKCSGNVENFRSTLTYMAHSIPTIKTYSHVHHLMRFAKLTIDPTPVVFWFEKWRAEHSPDRTQDAL